MIKKIRQLAQALVICIIISAVGCGAGGNSTVTVSIPLDPQASSISGLKGQIKVSGMSGTYTMTIGTSTATATIGAVPEGSRTFTITFYVGSDVSSGTIVAEISLTKSVSSDTPLNITYAASDISYDFDDDGDGYTNYDEIKAGTDPEDSSSHPSGGGTGTPPAPTNLTATAVSGPTVNLAWTDNSTTETGFGLEYSYDGTTWNTWVTVNANVTQYADSSVTSGYTYYYRVYSYNTYGNSSYSNVAQVTISGGGSAWTASFLGAGGYHTCAVTSTGGVKCWGDNGNGQLGNGSSSGPQTCNDGTNSVACSMTPVDVSTLSSGIAKVSPGGYHACVLTTGTTGGVKCWGYNKYGQLGNSSTTSSSTPVSVTGLSSGVIDISSGFNHTCALKSGGSVNCWGDDTYGQLGNGVTNTTYSSYQTVSGLTGATAISTGWSHTCAIVSGGAVKCWGANTYGQLGNGTTTDSSIPVSVSGISSGATSISASNDDSFTCAVVNGGVKCWGDNYYNQLGVSSSLGPQYCGSDSDPCSMTPVSVSSLTSGVTAVSTGGTHACALTSTGGVKCWGGGVDGSLGNGLTGDIYTPADVTGLTSGVSQISMGGFFSCARLSTGSLQCWGNNYYGQLGDGTTTQQNTPVDVSP